MFSPSLLHYKLKGASSALTTNRKACLAILISCPWYHEGMYWAFKRNIAEVSVDANCLSISGIFTCFPANNNFSLTQQDVNKASLTGKKYKRNTESDVKPRTPVP